MRVVIFPHDLRVAWGKVGGKCQLCDIGEVKEHFALQIAKRSEADMCFLSALRVCRRCTPVSGPHAAYQMSMDALHSLVRDVQDGLRGGHRAARSPDWQRIMLSLAALPIGPYVRRGACGACGSTKIRQECAICRGVAYCSTRCHAQHWRNGGHKTRCPTLAGRTGTWTFRLSTPTTEGTPYLLESTLLLGHDTCSPALRRCTEFFSQ
jgi:hypothetical protein